jgi:hypothetical protein
LLSSVDIITKKENRSKTDLCWWFYNEN